MSKNRQVEIAAAREADEKIAAAWDAFWDAQAPVEALRASIRQARKALSGSHASRAESILARIARYEAQIEAAEPAVAVARQAAVDLDAELYTGWARFFLVKHIHSSQSCSSFRATTRVGWLPKVSGLTEAEAVTEYGAILCTICFPSAPTEWTEGPKDDRCSGSGATISYQLPTRTGYYAGNFATCAACEKRVGISSRGQRIPKHQAD